MAGLGQHDEPAAQLLAGAQTWLRSRVADVHDLPTIRDAAGLAPEGRAPLSEITTLIDDRVLALTVSALDEQPDWLARLGPEPSNPTARQAWLDQLAATVLHHDRTPVVPMPAAPVSTLGLSR